MLLMNSNYENNETLNFQGLNYSKVILAFLDQGKLLTVANEMIKKKPHQWKCPRKDITDFLRKVIIKKKKNTEGNHSSIHLSRLNYSLL